MTLPSRQTHRRLQWLIAGAVILSMGLGTTPARASDFVPGKIVVGYVEGVTATTRGEILATAGAVPDESVVGLRADRATPSTGRSVDQVIAALKTDPRVRYAERDVSVSIATTKSPNDPRLADQWHHGNSVDADIDASAGWSSKTKCSKIAMLDTGIDVTHPDLRETSGATPRKSSATARTMTATATSTTTTA